MGQVDKPNRQRIDRQHWKALNELLKEAHHEVGKFQKWLESRPPVEDNSGWDTLSQKLATACHDIDSTIESGANPEDNIEIDKRLHDAVIKSIKGLRDLDAKLMTKAGQERVLPHQQPVFNAINLFEQAVRQVRDYKKVQEVDLDTKDGGL